MRYKQSGFVTTLLCVAVVSAATAQRGIVNGRIVERPKYIPGWPTYRFPGTDHHLFLEEGGRFRVEVLPGKYDLDMFVAPGAPPERRTILVKANQSVDVIITGPEGEGPVPAPSNIEEITEPGSTLYEIKDVGIKYHPQTKPVVSKSLEFTVRYEMADIGDSIRVTVRAEGRNKTPSAVETCGCLSFWQASFALGPEQVGQIPLAPVRDWYKGPKLEVPPEECATPTLDSIPTMINSGDAITRSMSFSFRLKDFEEKTGELRIQTYYFVGVPGSEWHDAERIDLGVIAVPIRIPGTMASYKF